jgi:hypothetical protein
MAILRCYRGVLTKDREVEWRDSIPEQAERESLTHNLGVARMTRHLLDLARIGLRRGNKI